MIIRLVTIGANYKDAMNYLRGQEVMRGSAIIDTIRMTPIGSVEVWVLKSGEIFLWKTFTSTMPISLEFDLDF